MKIKMFKTNDVKVPHPELFNLVKPNTYERKKNLQLQQHSSHKLLKGHSSLFTILYSWDRHRPRFWMGYVGGRFVQFLVLWISKLILTFLYKVFSSAENSNSNDTKNKFLFWFFRFFWEVSKKTIKYMVRAGFYKMCRHIVF